jgi:hypothetical protein
LNNLRIEKSLIELLEALQVPLPYKEALAIIIDMVDLQER